MSRSARLRPAPPGRETHLHTNMLTARRAPLPVPAQSHPHWGEGCGGVPFSGVQWVLGVETGPLHAAAAVASLSNGFQTVWEMKPSVLMGCAVLI